MSRYTFMQNITKMSAAVHQLSCTQTFSALPCNGKELENPVLWPWSLTYDLVVFWVSSGCQGTLCCKISSSHKQRFMSYRGHSEKNLDENNTACYRADSSNSNTRSTSQNTLNVKQMTTALHTSSSSQPECHHLPASRKSTHTYWRYPSHCCDLYVLPLKS